MIEDKFFDCGDATLHGRFRRARNRAARGFIICLPGLTRNAKDFDSIGDVLAADHDILALSLRGRGQSSNADYTTYHPEQYRDDTLRVLDHLGLDQAIFLGTSLGGITTMLLAEKAPHRLKAAIVNDIGPRLAPEGLARIGAYMAQREPQEGPMTFKTAMATIRAINEIAFPLHADDDAFWRAAAERTFRRVSDEEDAWIFDFDPGISKALAEIGAAPDLWPGFKALAERPTLVIRGAISDLLTAEIVAEMRAAHPDFDYAEVANIGHAPMLDEPDAVAAIKSFLDKLA